MLERERERERQAERIFLFLVLFESGKRRVSPKFHCFVSSVNQGNEEAVTVQDFPVLS